MQFTPYLNFNGNCKEAFEFYAELFGGEITSLLTFDQGPPEMDCPPAMKDMVMNAQLQIGNQLLMASDAMESYREPQGMHITIGVSKPEEAERVFAGLSEGGSVQMPMVETFWARRFGMLTDRYGIPWMVNCDK